MTTVLWVEPATDAEVYKIVDDWVVNGVTGVVRMPYNQLPGRPVENVWFCYLEGDIDLDALTEEEARTWAAEKEATP